jgi:hypothetical protein
LTRLRYARPGDPDHVFHQPPHPDTLRRPGVRVLPVVKTSLDDGYTKKFSVHLPDGDRYFGKRSIHGLQDAHAEATTAFALRHWGLSEHHPMPTVVDMDGEPLVLMHDHFFDAKPTLIRHLKPPQVDDVFARNGDDHVKRALFGEWLTSTGDRHESQYWVHRGRFVPTDFGFSWRPSTNEAGDPHHSALYEAAVSRGHLRDRPLDPNLVSTIVNTAGPVRDRVVRDVLPHFDAKDGDRVLSVFDGKLDWLRRQVESGKPVRLDDLPSAGSFRSDLEDYFRDREHPDQGGTNGAETHVLRLHRGRVRSRLRRLLLAGRDLLVRGARRAGSEAPRGGREGAETPPRRDPGTGSPGSREAGEPVELGPRYRRGLTASYSCRGGVVRMSHDERPTLRPGEMDEDGAPYEPPTEPDLGEFIRNQFRGNYGDSPHMTPETGYLLRDGTPVQMGMDGVRGDDHRGAIPTPEAMRRWGWPEEVVRRFEDGERGHAMIELMRRSGAVRVMAQGKRDMLALHFTSPLTGPQKSAVHRFVGSYAPSDVILEHEGGNTADLTAPKPHEVARALETIHRRSGVRGN